MTSIDRSAVGPPASLGPSRLESADASAQSPAPLAAWHKATSDKAPPYRIRPSTDDDLEALPAIEAATAPQFAPYGLEDHFTTVTTSAKTFAEIHSRDTLWIAADCDSDQPVGYAMAAEVDDTAHLEELAVHPRHQRHGLGTALVAAVVDWATTASYGELTLLTLRGIPWLMPFYRRLGFSTCPAIGLSPGLADLLIADDQASPGVPPEMRVVMRHGLATRAAVLQPLQTYEASNHHP